MPDRDSIVLRRLFPGDEAVLEERVWPALVTALLAQHYDPAYLKSLSHNYAPSPADRTLSLDDVSPASLLRVAQALVD